MTEIEFKTPSSDKIHTLSGVVFVPSSEPIGLFHVVHGMTDHISRYASLMRELCEIGYICFGFDNLGHGYTANDNLELGFIAEKNGHDLLARDVKLFFDAVKMKFDRDNKLPYYLLGHSMGSFITRLAVQKYVKPSKLIIMGTGGKNPATNMGLVLAWVVKRLRGERYTSAFLDKMAFGSYNDRFGGATADDPLKWLSNDSLQRKKYYADKFCTFKFTVSAMGDLVRLNKLTNQAKWFREMPKNIPVLLVSGGDDPVGSYGKGVIKVAEGLKKQGIETQCILYPKARHEILNDFTYQQVKEDIVEFISC